MFHCHRTWRIEREKRKDIALKRGFLIPLGPNDDRAWIKLDIEARRDTIDSELEALMKKWGTLFSFSINVQKTIELVVKLSAEERTSIPTDQINKMVGKYAAQLIELAEVEVLVAKCVLTKARDDLVLEQCMNDPDDREIIELCAHVKVCHDDYNDRLAHLAHVLTPQQKHACISTGNAVSGHAEESKEGLDTPV